jgi:hypothetical protein
MLGVRSGVVNAVTYKDAVTRAGRHWHALLLLGAVGQTREGPPRHTIAGSPIRDACRTPTSPR